MTKNDLGTLSVCATGGGVHYPWNQQYKAVWDGDAKTYNPLFYRMQAIKAELKSRPGDERRALKALYDHPNVQVRLMAARSTLALALVEARRVIELIAASNQFPYAGDTGMCLYMLDSGAFVPK